VTDSPILHTALELASLGYSVIPIRDDGTKAPALTTWKTHTQTPADEAQIRTWFTHPGYDLGVVQGAVSGHAELTEVEGRAAHHLPTLRDLAHDTGLGALWDTITQGWVEVSPSGGFHFHYRLTDAPVPGNTKLARDTDKTVLAETRGEGGQVVVAPSRHHTTGRPWTRLLGNPATAPAITLEQRDAFHSILRTLDTQPEPPARDNGRENMPAGIPARAPGDGITPGDDYENKTDWADILQPHGWTLVFTRGRTRYWRRPGKTLGFSATTGHADDRDRLYVFTTSTDFQAEIPYTKLGALAVLEHGGNHSDAAKALHAGGYGQRAQQPRQIATTPDTHFDDILGPTNGAPPWTPTPASVTSSPAATATKSAAPSAATPDAAPAPSTTSPATIEGPAFYTETDDGNALRLVDTHHQWIRHVPQRGQWLRWDGARWNWDEAGHIHELARAIARTLPDDGKEARAHRRSSLSRRGLEAMEKIARTDPRIVVHLTDLDARPYELNTPAGVVDLRTGTLHAPDPAALHTRSTTVAPDPHHPTPRWNAFLADTFAGDPDTATYVQRLLGVSLVGTVLEHTLPFAFGPGHNGKSVLFDVAQGVLGLAPDGYSASIPADMLVARAREDHPAVIAQLAGVRLAIGGELEEGARFAEAKVKMLTGGDRINARFMGKNPFTFTPTHSLWLHANHRPEVRTGGPAFWRRLRQIPFPHTVPDEKKIEGLDEILVAEEGPGILAWFVQGAADYFAHGLTVPASVEAATAEYQRDTDTVTQFVEERCTTGNPNAQHLHVKTTVLRTAYDAWCRTEGLEAVSAKGLTLQLKSRFGVESSRSNSARFYDGIALNDLSPEDDEPSPAEVPDGFETGW